MREKLKSTGTEEFLKELSDRIKSIRKARHLRQVDVADFLGVTERHYRLCESGKVDWPSSKLKALTQLFGVSFGELLSGRPNMSAGQQ